jgi:expansin (peptidoglycan-binding protein)
VSAAINTKSVTSTKRLKRSGILVLVVLVATAAGCRILPGQTYTGEGTYYAGDGSGNCSYPAGGSVLYAAMNETDYESSLNCGAYIQATGPKGTVTVIVADRCPECAPGDIDFSPQAFAQVADLSAGRVPISWHLVSAPPSISNIQFVVKDGSNPWWVAFQVRQHANTVTGLEVQVSGRWVALERQQYNYFLASSGLGTGPFTIRVTDIYGQQLVQSGITLSPTVVQDTSLQFTRH